MRALRHSLLAAAFLWAAVWSAPGWCQLAPGGGATVTIGAVTIAPSAASAAGIAAIPALNAATSVLKAAAGNLYSAYAINRTTTAGFLIAYNATAAPVDGALTAAQVLACAPLPASGVGSINYAAGPPGVFGTGITLIVTSAANCATKTTGVITADIFGSAQ